MAPVGTEAAAKRQRIATKSTPSGPPPAMAAPQAAPQRASSASAGKSPRGTAASSTSGTRASASAVLTARPGAFSASAGPSPTGPGPECRALRAELCKGLSDSYKHGLNKSARKQIKGPGAYRSHTERYRADLAYRANMIAQNVPEWLVFHSTGHTSRLDGVKGDQWSL